MTGIQEDIVITLKDSHAILSYRLPQFKEEPKSYVGTNMKKVGSDLKVHLLSPVQTSLTSRLQCYGILLLSSKDMLLSRCAY